VGHVYARTEGLCGVVISDKEYPLRVAYSLLTKILDEFLQKYPLSKVKASTGNLDFPELQGVLLPSIPPSPLSVAFFFPVSGC
jgi:synaptobrevin family protein YKT6